MSILSHFGFYNFAEMMRMNPVLFSLAYHRVSDIGWFQSGGSDDFAFYDFSTGTVHAYPAENIVPVKRQKVDDGSVWLFMAPAIDVSWLPGLAPKTISEVERDYRRYRGINDDDSGQFADVSTDVVDDFDDVFAEKLHWEGDDESLFIAGHLSVTATALAWLSYVAPTSGPYFASLVKGLVDDLEASQAATARAERKADRQKGLVLQAEKLKSNALNDVASSCGRVMFTGTHEAELLYSASAASSQIAGVTAELGQVCNTISIRSVD